MQDNNTPEHATHYTPAQWCRRYLSLNAATIAAALIYVLFFNDNSILNHYSYEHEISSLREQIRISNDTLRHYEELNRRLDTDRRTMEQIVREQYHMQRPDEDIYIVKQ